MFENIINKIEEKQPSAVFLFKRSADMVIPLIDQRLFLCEQYITLQEMDEARLLINTLEAYWEQLTDQQRLRVVQLLIQLEQDEQLIRYFETGFPVQIQHTQALALAYAREGLPEVAQALIAQLSPTQQVEAQQALEGIEQEQYHYQLQTVMKLLQATAPKWELIITHLTTTPKLWQEQVVTNALEIKWQQGTMMPPYCAIIIDLGIQQQYQFVDFPKLQPLQQTRWVQEVNKAIANQRENYQLFQELATMQILQIYPQTPQVYGFATVEALIADLQVQLDKMLAIGE